MSNQKDLDRLNQGVEHWNQWKTDISAIQPEPKWNWKYDADLSEANLEGRILDGINLGKVDMNAANLSRASLVEAVLTDAELADGDLQHARLTRADLRDANLVAANLSHADLRGANLDRADLSGANLEGADLSGASLRGADLSDISLEGVFLDGAILSEAYYGRYFPYKHRRQVRAAGGIVSEKARYRQGSYRLPRLPFQKHKACEEIVLYPVLSIRLLTVMLGALVCIGASVWVVTFRPGQLLPLVIAAISVLFCGLGLLINLGIWLRCICRPTPVLAIDKEGFHYLYQSVFQGRNIPASTYHSISLAWKDIGAIGVARQASDFCFAVYDSTRRCRSGWGPSLVIPQSLLSISATGVLALIALNFEEQLETHHILLIENIEATDALQKQEE